MWHLQHDFEALKNADVVESWVAKADFKIGEETVKKGTWLMTVEVTDDDIWDAVQKGEITGFSMGGVGKYDTEDTDLENVEKGGTPATNEQAERKGIFKKLATMFGFDVVEKGEMKDEYEKRNKASSFWNAFYTLEDILYRYDYSQDRWSFENDEQTIREALLDFNNIISDILAGSGIAKSLAPSKGEMSAGRKTALENIQKSVGTILADANNETEEIEMTKTEIEKIVADAVAKSLNAPAAGEAAPETPAPGNRNSCRSR